MSQQRKHEIIEWLKQRLNAGLIQKQEMQAKLKQIDQNMHLLMAADTARQFTMSIGIMQAQDAEILQSPNTVAAEKGKAKDIDQEKVSRNFRRKNFEFQR